MKINADYFNRKSIITGSEIYKFLISIRGFPWFENVGNYQINNSEVIRVQSIDEAWDRYPLGKKKFLKMILQIRETFDIAASKDLLEWENWEAARDISYKIVKSLHIKCEDNLMQGKAAAWASNTTLEILVSFMPYCPFYFRRMIPWYRDGHWPVTIRDSDDKIIVY